jgi:chemotaxis protein methyltransferase CheR
VTPQEFDYVSGMLKRESGLVLGRDKVYLLESRLVPIARQRGLPGLSELIKALMTGADATLAKIVVDAMTTNETFFFRDIKPFDQFKTVTMTEIMETRASKKSLRIWSAACSSGQEPYTLAMILKEMEAKLAGWRIEILATDLSNDVLEKAKRGAYTQFEVQRGLPVQLLVKYFTQTKDAWMISDVLKNMVTYRPFNLLGSYMGLGTFDVIFCRNVLIYFDQETKGKVLDNMVKLMPSDGTLYLGGAETVLGVTNNFQPVAGQRGLYRPVAGAAGAKV